MTVSIATRVKSAILVVAIFLITISIVLFCYFFRKTLYLNEIQTMESIGTLTSFQISKSMSSGDYINVDNVINKTTFPEFIQDVRVVDAAGKQVTNFVSVNNGCSDTGLYEFLIKGNSKNVFDSEISSIGKVNFTIERCRIQKKISNIIFLVTTISLVLFGLLLLLIPKIIQITLDPLLKSITKIQKGHFPEIFFLENAPIEIKPLMISLKKVYERAAKFEISEEFIKTAKQLSHDIRSPLAALRVVKDMGAGEMAPELSKLLGMSIDRITDIANTILPKEAGKKHESENIVPCFLWMLVDQIISEKRVEYKNESNISIQFESDQSPFLMNAFCDSTEFMRSVSNMINNSIEARVSNQPIEIKVRLNESEDQIILSIVDNGKGIPAEVLSKVFHESFSHGKKQGTGLGLHQVKQAIESWGGKIGIESQINVGTTMTIKLKKSEKPEWLTEPIEIKKYDSIVVLDDEEYVFTILEDRFSEYGKKIEYYKSIKEFESKLGQQTQHTLYLMDHDLKQNQTGLELIEKYQLQKQAILLTGNYDDKSVQQTAIKINAKILPKPLIHDLPIVS